MASKLPSKISAVLFRRADGWTPSRAKEWLRVRGVTRPKAPRTVESKGGDILKPGSYIKFNIRTERETQGFTSFGYMPELKNYPGVYFQIGGHRGARERFSDHLGPEGKYYVETSDGYETITDGPYVLLEEAVEMAEIFLEQGFKVNRVYEEDPEGNFVRIPRSEWA